MFKYLDKEFAVYLVQHQHHFPVLMRDYQISAWETIIDSTPYSLGYFIDDSAVAWRIFKREMVDTIYVSELLVLPEHRGKGIAKSLIKKSLEKPLQNKERIHSFLREEAYKAVADENLIQEAGYRIVVNQFIEDHYFGRFGLHEHAYELLIEPQEK